MYFNSQPHKEADVKCGCFLGKIDISTHSLTRRLTYDVMPNPPVGLNFNSQPHKEADRN